MKNIGIVRSIDDLGRIVIPREIRRTLGLEKYHKMEVQLVDDYIVLKKHIVKINYEEIIEKYMYLHHRELCIPFTDEDAEELRKLVEDFLNSKIK